MDRHGDHVAALRRAVFESSGDANAGLRQAASENRQQDLPEALRAYVDKVARHAYKVTDDEVDALKQGGYSEDQLFELTVSAAVGAGLARLEAGLAALRPAGKGK